LELTVPGSLQISAIDCGENSNCFILLLCLLVFVVADVLVYSPVSARFRVICGWVKLGFIGGRPADRERRSTLIGWGLYVSDGGGVSGTLCCRCIRSGVSSSSYDDEEFEEEVSLSVNELTDPSSLCKIKVTHKVRTKISSPELDSPESNN
jgi:hypothetical protein